MEHGLPGLPAELLERLLSALDVNDHVSVISSCKTLWEDRNDQQLLCKAIDELYRNHLEQNPATLDKSNQIPFGNHGNFALLAHIPPALLVGAFQLLYEEYPHYKRHVETLVNRYLTRHDILATAERFSEWSKEHSNVHLGPEELEEWNKWTPQPCAIYITMCVVDWYLLKILTQKRCYIDGERPTLGCIGLHGIRRGLSVVALADFITMGKQDIRHCHSCHLDGLLAWSIEALHPVHHFGTAIDILDSLYREHELYLVEAEMFDDRDFIATYRCGLYMSNVDDRLHVISTRAWATWKKWELRKQLKELVEQCDPSIAMDRYSAIEKLTQQLDKLEV